MEDSIIIKQLHNKVIEKSLTINVKIITIYTKFNKDHRSIYLLYKSNKTTNIYLFNVKY